MKHILIVDDDLSFMASLKVGLKQYSGVYKFHMAGNGIEALEILKKTPIDIVVTDIKMPRMGGFELLMAINNDFPSVAVIVMSAFGTEELRQQAEELGTLKFLDKPLDINQLMKAINESFERQVNRGVLKGISLSNFIQIIEMEKKTCVLDVKIKNKKEKGYFYFEEGKLHDASFGKLKGEEAAVAILASDDEEIGIRDITKKRGKKDVIKKPIINILMEGMKLKDDKVNIGNLSEAENNIENKPENDKNIVEKSGKDKPMTLQETQEYLRDNLDGLLVTAIVDAKEGMPLAVQNIDPSFDVTIPAGMYTSTFRSAVKAFEVVGWGVPTEVLMPGDPNSVILVSLKGGQYFQGIAFTSKTQLGMVRAILNKIKPKIEELL